MRHLAAFYCLILFSVGNIATAQNRNSDEEGIFYSRYFSPKEYKANPQNWAALQLPNGVMAFGNGDGLMTFDGSRWQLARLSNNNLVRAIALGTDGTLYAAGYNELGFIRDDSLGAMRFISLMEKLPADERTFGHVRNIFSHNNKVYFVTDEKLLSWDGSGFKVIAIRFEDVRVFATLYEGKFLIQPSGHSLFVLEGDSLARLPGGDFYDDKQIISILPHTPNAALVCTMDHGMFLYDGTTSTPFSSDLTDFLRENRLYKTIRLSDETYALGTLNGGVATMSNDGSLVRRVEKGHGLGDNAVYNLEEDRQGGLWVTMSVGISRVELQNPMTWFDERNGLAGAVNDIVRFNGELYVATMLGLYKLQRSEAFKSAPKFHKVEEISSSVWATTVRHESLLLATDEGTAEVTRHGFKFLDEYSGAVLFGSRHDPNIVFVGLTDGLVVLRYTDGSWHTLGRMEHVEADVGEMNEDHDGNLWVGTFSEGAVLLKFRDVNGIRDYVHPDVTLYGEKEGLPVGYLQIHNIGEELVFRVEPDQKLYQFDEKKNGFAIRPPDDAFPHNDSISVYPFSNELNDEQWLIRKNHHKPEFDFLLRTKNGSKEKLISFSRVHEDVDEVIFTEDGIAWLGGLDGVVRFEYAGYEKADTPFEVVLNKIMIGNDSVLYSGINKPPAELVLPYDLSTIAFSYGAASYDLPSENEYQYILEGFDDGWSRWTKDVTKSYTRIREGSYVFKVRARNVYSQVSKETRYAFIVSPPWYRHPAAYVGYAILVAGLVFLFVKMWARELEKEKAVLERTVKERTQEISVQNQLLEQQSEELKTQTEQLKEMDKIKSHFFTNMSHEFRTPLSLILAPLEKELAENPGNSVLNVMHRNARRLQNLINQLLDLSKLEAGQMKVFLSRNDLTSFITTLASSFQPLAENKNIAYTWSVPSTPLERYFDADKLETIFYNLLSNAFKFTPPGGQVSFTMNLTEPNDSCEFIVRDTGPGISEGELSKIFDRFYQVDTGVQREYEGTGIGLALTRELIILMQGDITVESKHGEGTAFHIILPFSKSDRDVIPGEVAFQYKPLHEIPRDEDGFNESDRGERFTVLLVEDNKDLNAYLVSVLEKIYDVISTSNGEEALAAARENIPDLILSDMMMPKMDGFSLCEHIRKDETTSHIPFILLTARATVESRLAGLELGADDYMTKPFNVTELQIRIKNLLQQRNNLKRRFQKELKVAPKDVTVTSLDEKFLNKVMEEVQLHLGDLNFSVEELSSAVGMSRKNLHRKLVALVDQTPNGFIRVFRLKTAMQLLEQQAGTVKEIAFKVGFNNLSYFSKCFREQFGVAPTDITPMAKSAPEEKRPT